MTSLNAPGHLAAAAAVLLSPAATADIAASRAAATVNLYGGRINVND